MNNYIINKLLITMSLLIFNPSIAFSSGPSSSDLYESCSSEDISIRVVCASYILGYVDGLNSGAITVMYDRGEKDVEKLEKTALKNIGFCIPEHITSGDYADIFVSQYKKDPEIRTLKANQAVYIALIEEFFCTR